MHYLCIKIQKLQLVFDLELPPFYVSMPLASPAFQ